MLAADLPPTSAEAAEAGDALVEELLSRMTASQASALLASDEEDHVFSFRSVCESLGLLPEQARRSARRLARRQQHALERRAQRSAAASAA